MKNSSVFIIFIMILLASYLFTEVPACKDIPVSELTEEKPEKVVSSVIKIENELDKNGYVILSTLGKSMEPKIYENQKCGCVKQSSYELGDIVVYSKDMMDNLIGHRIVYENESSFKMRGDNNNFTDSSVLKKNVICKIPTIKRYQLL